MSTFQARRLRAARRAALLTLTALTVTAVPATAAEAVVAPAVDFTTPVRLQCTWEHLGIGPPPGLTEDVRLTVEVRGTVPATVDRTGTFELSNLSTTIKLPETGGPVIGGEGFQEAVVISNRFAIGARTFDPGASGPRPPVSLSGDSPAPTTGVYPTFTAPTSEVAWNQYVRPSHAGLTLVVYRRAPYFGSSRLDCTPLIDTGSTLYFVTINPVADAPAITRVLGNGLSGVGGLVELRGRNLAKVRSIHVDDRRAAFYRAGSSIFVVLPNLRAGVKYLKATGPSGDVSSAYITYAKLF